MSDHGTDVRVGLVGANPDQGWAFAAHVPAIRAIEGLRVTAVATTRMATAQRAADLLGGVQAYDDARSLAESPEVDLVVVAVKVPYHAELVRAALAAGKHVYCEWPLALSTAEAEQLAGQVQPGQRGFVGLQGRANPAVLALRDAVITGQLGEIQAVSARSSRSVGATAMPAPVAYTLDRRNGAGTREVLGGHLLDMIDFVTGGISHAYGISHQARSEYVNADTGSILPSMNADTMASQLRFGDNGVGAAIWWDGDILPGTRIEVQGLSGRATLISNGGVGDDTQQPQMVPMTLEVTDNSGNETQRVTSPAPRDLPMPARNLANIYQTVLGDLRTDGTNAASFSDAVRLHQLLDAAAPITP